MQESRVEARLVRGVKALGGLCWKFVSPGTAGVPDRIVLLPGGRVALVELKQKTGRLSAIQRLRRRELRQVGAEVWTLYGPSDVDRFLSECGTPPLQTETALCRTQGSGTYADTPESKQPTERDCGPFTERR